MTQTNKTKKQKKETKTKGVETMKKKGLLLCLILSSMVAKGETSLEDRVLRLEKILGQQVTKNEQLQKQLDEKKVVVVKDDTVEERISKLEKEASLWDIHGYASLQYRSTNDWSSTGANFGKGDFFLGIPGTGESANQVEIVAKRKFEGKNGVWGNLNLRAEYGNGDSYYYSSSGSEHDNGKGNFEIKEAFIDMGGFDYLPEDSVIWAGRRFVNRNSTILSGEFYKQSSGVGFGYENKGFSANVVAVDPGAENGKSSSTLVDGKGRRTVTAFDLNYAGINVPGGSLDVGAKYYIQPNAQDPTKDEVNKAKTDVDFAKNLAKNLPRKAKDGFGVGVVYNTSYYGFDGFASHAINYGQNIGAHATGGMNFGQWTDNAVKDAHVILATTGGMLNVNEKLQVATETSVMYGNKLYGLSGHLTRAGFSIQPSYKINDNFRMVVGASFGLQKIENHKANWGGQQKKTQHRVALSLAPTFTADSDFFGRPQIQPYVTYLHTNFNNGFGDDLKKEKSQVIFGVKSEVWF